MAMKIWFKKNIIYNCSVAIDDLLFRVFPARKTNRCFHSIFYDKESKDLAGKGFGKFIRLVAIYFFTLAAIAYAARSHSDLKEKMKDPFVLTVTADIPNNVEINSLQKYVDMDKYPEVQEKAIQYDFRNIYQYYKFANFFLNSDDESAYFSGRTINHDDPIMSKILDTENLIVGHGFDTLKSLSINSEDIYSVIVTEEMYNELYPPQISYEFPYLDLLRFDSASYKQDQSDEKGRFMKEKYQKEYFSREYAFPFLIDPNYHTFIPISAIVEKLPDGKDFLTTQEYYQSVMNYEGTLIGKYDAHETLSFLVQLNDICNPVETLTSNVSSGTDNCIYSEEYIEQIQDEFSKILLSAESNTDITSYVKDMLQHVSNTDKIEMSIREYMMSYRPMLLISVRLSSPAFYDDLHSFINELETSDALKSSSLYNDIMDIIPFYNPDLNTSMSYKDLPYNAIGINFNDTDGIENFPEVFEDETRVELEMSLVEALRNYNAVTNLMTILIIALVITSFLFILTLLNSTMQEHLLKTRRNLGTFMAMGINMKSLYKLVMFTYIILSGLLGLFAVIFINELMNPVVGYRLALVDFRLIILLAVLLISGSLSMNSLLNRFFNKPPGMLIYADDDKVMEGEKRFLHWLKKYRPKWL